MREWIRTCELFGRHEREREREQREQRERERERRGGHACDGSRRCGAAAACCDSYALPWLCVRCARHRVSPSLTLVQTLARRRRTMCTEGAAHAELVMMQQRYAHPPSAMPAWSRPEAEPRRRVLRAERERSVGSGGPERSSRQKKGVSIYVCQGVIRTPFSGDSIVFSARPELTAIPGGGRGARLGPSRATARRA